MVQNPRRPLGFARADLGAVLVSVALLAVIALPVIAWGGGASRVTQSMSNLTTLGIAHIVYASDWNGRQITWTRDDLGFYGGMDDYNGPYQCQFIPIDPECHPRSIAGWGELASGSWGIWAYFPSQSISPFVPISFPDGPGYPGWGSFYFITSAPFHYYVNGRYQDATYYAPNDTTVIADVEACLDEPAEFVGGACNGGVGPCTCNPGWSSYILSPAAMFHPDVMRANANGGFQDPWTLGYGLESPGLFQTQYPDLKSQMIEHHWIQNPPAECNPAFSGCTPYYFNHGLDSTPVTLFYDGSVRLLSNLEVLLGDSQVLSQTGGVDGLWHRGTPFGADGYFIPDGFDFVPLSHHVLTTDGILGRDTLGGAVPMPAQTPSWEVPPASGPRRPTVGLPNAPAPAFTPQDEGP
jgi:hypothetical protein